MTSEGQHAGQQPAEATSGGPAELARGGKPKANQVDEPNGGDGFQPDPGGRGRASVPTSAASYPVSYGPPPQSTPNGGSPFVVPTVFGQPAERQASDAAPSRIPPPPGYGAAATPPSTGSARAPRPDDGSGLPQRSSSLPQRGAATPVNAAAVPPGDNGSPPGSPPSAWAPPPAAAEDSLFARPAESHPYRSATPEPHPYRGTGDLDGDPASDAPGDYAGFAPGSPTRVRAGLDPADSPNPSALPDRPHSPFDRTDPADHSGSALGRAGSAPEQSGDGRPPGVSPFGAQRVRVPGATLTGLPDAPPLPRAPLPNEGSGFPMRSGPNGLDAANREIPQRQSPYGSPAGADVRGGMVPHPRDSAERATPAEPGNEGVAPGGRSAPAVGSARPVAASASVPVASRVAPPADPTEQPSAAAAPVPQPRVYGRATPAQESDSRDAQPDSLSREPQPGEVQSADQGRPLWATPPAAEQAEGRTLWEPSGQPRSGGPRPWDAPGQPGAAQPGNAQPWEAQSGPAQAAAQPWEAQSGTGTSREVQPWEPPSSAGPVRDGKPWEAPSERAEDAAPGSPGVPYPSRSSDDRRGPGGFGPESQAPTPQSPSGRVSGRATASARVAPPGNQPFAPGSPAPDAPAGPPLREPSTDVAGRGRANVPAQQSGPSGRTTPPESYGENTTDISGRGPGSDGVYVPAPALPSMHARPPLENGFPPVPKPGETADDRGGRPRLGGVFPGPASRGTVTPPPDPDSTTSWPSPAGPAAAPGEPEAGRFDQFKPEADAAASTKAAETPHVRMVPVLLSVIIGATLLVGLAVGIPWLISGGNDTGFSVSTGDCVKKSADEAVKAACGDPGSFEVASIVTAKEQCADPGQPYVLNPTANGKTQVLCLKPRS